jgi:APA family basic amino acid/polyamine antiporter
MATTSLEPAQQQLTRGLGLLDATMIVVGSMIGSGIFIVSAESSRLVGAPGWLLLAWIVSGVMTITGALCCAELAAMYPHAGGTYVFLRKSFGAPVGFLFGWAMLLVIQTATIAAVAIGFGKFTGVLFPRFVNDVSLIDPILLGGYAVTLSPQQLVGMTMILFLTWVNMRGLTTGKIIQNIFTVAKTTALIGLIVLGLTLGWNSGAAAFTSSWWDPSANPGWPTKDSKELWAAGGSLVMIMLLGRAMIGPIFSQTAWNNVTFTGSEVVEPHRTLPRSLLLGCGLVVLLYVLANLAYLVTLSLEEIQQAPSDRVATAALEKIFGPTGAFFMAGLIMISTFGCNNGLILAGARIYYAMARDGLFFKSIGRLNRNHAPALALLIQGIWAALLTLPRTVTTNKETGLQEFGNLYGQLLEFLIPMDVLFYALMVVAVFLLRWRAPAAPRPYRTWGYPVVPFIYLVLSIFVVVNQIYHKPDTSGIGLLIVCSGVPVYFLWAHGRHRDQSGYGASPPQGPDKGFV